jgi:hypothetical protein
MQSETTKVVNDNDILAMTLSLSVITFLDEAITMNY